MLLANLSKHTIITNILIGLLAISSAPLLHAEENFEELTIADAQAQMQAGTLSSQALVEWYLQRIKKIDKNGPALNSIIELNPDAIGIAKALDQERKQKGPRSPIHGIPILLKDNIDTGDKMQTTAGSLALLGSPASKDAFHVTKLREAGAVILGKTNLSEWANFRSSHSSSGWSSRGGQTKNPYIISYNPCGSSSGSAVAVSANLTLLAIGTETDGSVVCPSSINGIVGIKPTLGLVSRSGIVPIAHSQDTAGPMARTVTDAVILLGLMSAADSNDSVTTQHQKKIPRDYSASLKKDGLKDARIGIARNYFGRDKRVDEIMENAITTMKNLGAIMIDNTNIETIGKFDETEFEVLLYEFKTDMNLYLKQRGHPGIKSLEDIIGFNETHAKETMPYFGQDLLVTAQAKGSLTDKNYLQALKQNHLLARDQGIDATLKIHKLDAIIAPTQGPSWTTDHVNGDHFTGSSSSAPAVAGYPNITVPAGYIHSLPIGISFFGTAFDEAKLIQYAYTFEQASQKRKKPEFKTSINQ